MVRKAFHLILLCNRCFCTLALCLASSNLFYNQILKRQWSCALLAPICFSTILFQVNIQSTKSQPPSFGQRLWAALLVWRGWLERRVCRAEAGVLRCCGDVVGLVGLVVDALPPGKDGTWSDCPTYLGQLSASFRTLGCFLMNFLDGENNQKIFE